jgi:DHA1 family bicyclomycin/chloramphenicol resistance-like MFS transporter
LTPAAKAWRVAPGSGAFIALIAALMTLTAMSIDINLPAIPATARALGAGLTTTQLTVTLFFGGFAVGQLVWGLLSDRTGRKPTLMAGFVLYEITTIGCALAPDIGTLLTMRVLQGFAAGAAAVLGRAVVRDLFEGPQMARILSLALAAFITAPIVAPSIGAVILSLAGWRWIFGFLAIYGAVLMALAALFLEESLQARNPHALQWRRLAQAFAAVFRDPRSRSAAAIVTLIFGALTIYLTNASAVLMEGYGLDAAAFGAAFALVAGCSSAGNLLNSRLVRQLPLSRVIRLALAAALVSALLALVPAVTGLGGVWALVAGLGLFFVAFGLVAANATTLALQPHGAIAGSAAAALGFAQTVAPAAVASLVAACYDGTARPMLVAIILLVAVSWLASMRLPAK